MAITIIRHRDGSTYERGGGNYIYTERARVKGLTAVAPGSEVSILDEAINASVTPKLGDSLGAPFVNLILVRQFFERIGCDPQTDEPFIDFSFTWKVPRPNEKEPDDNGTVVVTTGVTLETVEAFQDINGNKIVVTYKGKPWGGSVQRQIPRRTIKVSRREVSNPRSRMDTYVGKANFGLWNGYASGTVLCGPILSSSEDNGESYNVEYEFVIRADGWEKEEVVFYDVNTDSFPSDVTLGDGIIEVDNVALVSFSGLNISL